ncbi:tetratricopeptide repeat protein [Streptomyces sp. YGL11-2]|uniref:tetratricopeptide repeat protein n=1 Tax=Streptomyces sp. YGL11-2 TaxID=3414028 RepID=UPI003CF5CD96
MRRFDEAITAHETARTLFHEQGDTHGEATAWNNLGTVLRAQQRFHEAATAGERAAALLDAAKDPFRAGEALGELAVTLTAADADAAEVRSVWLRAAAAYERANAAAEAENARAEADKRA